MAQRGEETGNGGAIIVHFNLMSTRPRRVSDGATSPKNGAASALRRLRPDLSEKFAKARVPRATTRTASASRCSLLSLLS